MKPIRFLIFFALAYGMGISISFFLLFSARILGEPNLLLASLVIVILLTALFGWLYFRGVRNISWRARAEAIGVWMALIFVLDMIVLVFLMGGSMKDINLMYVTGLGLQLLGLFVAAYVTAVNHPRISSPDLSIKAAPQTKK